MYKSAFQQSSDLQKGIKHNENPYHNKGESFKASDVKKPGKIVVIMGKKKSKMLYSSCV